MILDTDKLLVDELDIKPAKFLHSSGYCSSCKKAKHPQLEAAGSGHESCLQYSLQTEGLIAKDSFGATALHIAARKGMTQSLQCIVDVCSPVEAFRAHNKATPAHDAAGTGHMESLIFLIENTACTAHDRDKNQATPLHWAAQLGHTEVVDWLISDAGAQPDVKNTAGLTPIHLAAARNKLDTLKWLSNYLKNHYDSSEPYIDARALNGETPLYFAAQEGHLQIVTWLVEKMKSNLSVRAHDGLAPVHAAAQEGHLYCLKYLLSQKGANLLSADSATPGHFAASQGHVECLRWMLGNRVLTGREVDVYSSTIAHDAAENGQLEILTLLYKRGANFSAQNEDKCTPLDLAVKNDHKECVVFLKNPDVVVKKTRRISAQESAQSQSSAFSSLPPSASEVAGPVSQPAPTSDQGQEASNSKVIKQRKLTPMPPPVGATFMEQKWAEKLSAQAPNIKHPRVEEWVSSTIDQQNLKKAPSLDDDSEADLLAPVDSETQKKLTSEVMSKSGNTKLSDLQAHLQWVSQSSGGPRPGESNIAEKEKDRIFDEVLRSEQRQKQLESFGMEKEIESENQLREKEETKRQKYRELRMKEERDKVKSQAKMVAQKKEEERKFFEEQKYKYIIEEPDHFGVHKSGKKKKTGIIRRLSGLFKKNNSPYERRGQPDGADSESGSLEPFNKLRVPHSDISNYELYNIPAYRANKKGREARKR